MSSAPSARARLTAQCAVAEQSHAASHAASSGGGSARRCAALGTEPTAATAVGGLTGAAATRTSASGASSAPQRTRNCRPDGRKRRSSKRSDVGIASMEGRQALPNGAPTVAEIIRPHQWFRTGSASGPRPSEGQGSSPIHPAGGRSELGIYGADPRGE